MYLAGHKQPATTARYMRPQKHVAAKVLRAAAAAQPPLIDRSQIAATPPADPTAPLPSLGQPPSITLSPR
jgi:hypothetical protein